jgi:hypothetical protein
MAELFLLLRSVRRDARDPLHLFAHRLRVGALVAALILLSSCLG